MQSLDTKLTNEERVLLEKLLITEHREEVKHDAKSELSLALVGALLRLIPERGTWATQEEIDTMEVVILKEYMREYHREGNEEYLALLKKLIEKVEHWEKKEV